MSAELVEPVAALVILIGTISSVGSTLVSEVGYWNPWIRQTTWPIATKVPCWPINHPTGGTTAEIGKGPVGARFALFHCTAETHERNYSRHSGQSSTIGNSQLEDIAMSVIMVRQWHPAVLRRQWHPAVLRSRLGRTKKCLAAPETQFDDLLMLGKQAQE